MTGIWRLLFVLWAGSMLSACVAPLEFTSPLADPGTERVDPLLVGTWYGVSRCENDRSGPFDVGICDKTGGPPVMLTTLHLAAAPDGTSLAVRANVQALDVSDIIKEARDRVHGRVLQFQATAFPATLDGVAYYNIRRAAGVGYDYTGSGESPHFMLAQAELQDEDTLYLHVMDELPPNTPPMVKRTRGERPNVDLSYTIVDASREQIVAMIRGADLSELFTYRIGPFRRLKRFDSNDLETELCFPDGVRHAARFMALSDTALHLARFGQDRQAYQTANAALQQYSRGVTYLLGSYSLGTVAEALAIIGDVDHARALLNRDLKGSEVTLSAIRAQARLGPVSDALKMIQEPGSYYDRSVALENIALIRLEMGDTDGALATASMIDNERLMNQVAVALHRAGHTAAALKLLQKKAADVSMVVEHRLETAQRQLEWGDTDGARRTVEMFESWLGSAYLDKPEWTAAFLRIPTAELLAALGQENAARAMIEPVLQRISAADLQRWPVEQAVVPPDATSRLLALQRKLGDDKGAQQTMDRLVGFIAQHRSELDDAAGLAAPAYVVMGNLSKALEIANGEGDTLYAITAIQRFLGDYKGADQTLKLALARTQQQSKDRPAEAWTHTPLLLDNARVHHESGDADGTAFYLAVLTEAAMMTHPDRVKVHKLLDAAHWHEEFGDIGGARATALHAMAVAEAMPLRETCGSKLLQLLYVPDLQEEEMEPNRTQ